MRYFLLPALAVSLVLSGCSSSKTSSTKENKPVVMTIGQKPVYADEFAYVYNKNNANAENAYSEQSLKEYLDLYTNFRLKVAEAESMGLEAVL
ncbi:MAG: peptidylprolyl isomerase, partial [Sphingobacteriales bacterium]